MTTDLHNSNSDLGETTQQTLSRVLQEAIIRKWDQFKYILTRYKEWEPYNEHVKHVVSFMRREGGYARNYKPLDLWTRVRKEMNELISSGNIKVPSDEEIEEWFKLNTTVRKTRKVKSDVTEESFEPVTPHVPDDDSDRDSNVEYFSIHDGDYGPVRYD